MSGNSNVHSCDVSDTSSDRKKTPKLNGTELTMVCGSDSDDDDDKEPGTPLSNGHHNGHHNNAINGSNNNVCTDGNSSNAESDSSKYVVFFIPLP